MEDYAKLWRIKDDYKCEKCGGQMYKDNKYHVCDTCLVEGYGRSLGNSPKIKEGHGK